MWNEEHRYTKQIDTVGELIAYLHQFPLDAVIRKYDGEYGLNYHVRPNIRFHLPDGIDEADTSAYTFDEEEGYTEPYISI